MFFSPNHHSILHFGIGSLALAAWHWKFGIGSLALKQQNPWRASPYLQTPDLQTPDLQTPVSRRSQIR
jgi:hypothetical protein